MSGETQDAGTSLRERIAAELWRQIMEDFQNPFLGAKSDGSPPVGLLMTRADRILALMAAPAAEPEGQKRPHTCPVCSGAGTVSKPPYVAGDQQQWSTSSLGPYPCRACSGTGVLWAAPLSPGPRDEERERTVEILEALVGLLWTVERDLQWDTHQPYKSLVEGHLATARVVVAKYDALRSSTPSAQREETR